ncbi:MAG: ABC transporter permease subunit [Mycobacterium sp.]
MGSDIANITRLDLRLRRRLIIGYTLGMAAYALIVIALYPAVKNQTDLNQLTDSTVGALIGASGAGLTSPIGWLNANLYGNFVPLIVLIATIGYGASCIAGQNEDGSLALVTVMPLTRGSVVVGKLTAMIVQALPVPVATALCVLCGRWFDLNVDAGPLLGVTVGVTLLGLVFGTLALFIGTVTGSRGIALGVTSGLAALAYLTNSLAPVINWLHPRRYLSPFFYAVGDNQLQHGLSLAWAGVLAAVALTFALAAAAGFSRLDVH